MAYSDLPDSLKAEYDRIGREREQASRDADRQYRWELIRVCGELAAWTVLGLALMGISFACTDRELGLVFVYGAFVVNYAGMATSLWAAYHRGEARGDW